MTQIPAAVRTLERDLREMFRSRLESFVVYGLHAHDATDRHDADDAHGKERPLVHTIAILDGLSSDDLRACAERAAKWHDLALATPLLLARHEFARSLDAFPLEFGAVMDDHLVLSGRNPFEGLRVDPADLRRACEVQARSHLLHLREGFVETRGRADGLAVLVVRSAAPFASLLKAVARLQGFAAHDDGALSRNAERTLGVAGGAVADVVKLAGVTEISSEEAVRIFPAYLDAVERLVKLVDGWKNQ